MAVASVAQLDERVLFSPGMPEDVNLLLQAAVAATRFDPERAEKLFMEAKAKDGQCLQTYFALYKFYFYQKRLREAEQVALAGLEEAARQGGFPNDYQRLVRELPRWDMYAGEAGLFYLYTLKALAFIRLRQGLEEDAQDILAHIRQLDVKDLSGASVVMDLAAGVVES
jgi:hypothetical protein